MKRGGGSFMSWGFFSVWIWVSHQGQRNKEGRKMWRFWKKSSSSQQQKLALCFVFQHDNDPRHMLLLVKNDLHKTKMSFTDWPVQSSDLNPTENLRGELKTNIHLRRQSNLEALKRFKIGLGLLRSCVRDLLKTTTTTTTTTTACCYQAKEG